MGIRLNKVLAELNIGLTAAVEFLKSHSELGEIRDDATPNTKISDDQYAALAKRYRGDKNIKKAATAIIEKKQANTARQNIMTRTKKEPAPIMSVIGKIDLDALNASTRPKRKTKEERRKEREERLAKQQDSQRHERWNNTSNKKQYVSQNAIRDIWQRFVDIQEKLIRQRKRQVVCNNR